MSLANLILQKKKKKTLASGVEATRTALRSAFPVKKKLIVGPLLALILLGERSLSTARLYRLISFPKEVLENKKPNG